MKTLTDWPIDGENVELWRKFNGNFWKSYKREILGKVHLKFEKYSSKILSISWLNLWENFSKKFIEISRKVSGMNAAKIFREF